MATKGTINVVGDFSQEAEKKLDAQRTINMYVRMTPEGKSAQALVPMPGKIKRKTFAGLLEVRNLTEYKNKMYAVVSDKIYSLNTSLTSTLLGTIGTANGYVGSASNVSQKIWVDGADGYVYDTNTSTFSTISSPGFPVSPQDVEEMDGYFIINEGNTNRFFISALNDGLSWDILNFEGIESRTGDVLIGIRALHRRLFLFGKISTEIWYNAGASDFPFRRDENMLLEYGCAAVGSIAVGYQKLFWLSGDVNGVGSVVMTDGTMPVPISTPAVDYAIQQFSSVADARGLIYKIDGHVFYELNFTAANHSFIYDATTNKWFEAETIGGNRAIANSHTFFNNKHYIGDYDNPDIYEINPLVYTDDGVVIPRTRISGHFAEPHYRKIRITRLQLDVVSGVGLPETTSTMQTSEYADPHVFLSFSKDGGVSFGDRRKKSFGKMGEREHRIIWRRLGCARDWVFKFEIMSKSKVFILGASIDYEVAGR